ncbi:MAG: TolC family protein [Candidatus Sulfotelmatobacter sp.]
MRRRDRNLLSILAGALALTSAAGLAGTSFAQAVKPTSSVVISLSDAIHRAQANEPAFANALAAQKTTRIDRYLARAALLPSVTYDNQLLYTQPNGEFIQGVQGGTEPAPIFIANNSIHEYISQASINETIGLKHFADAQVAAANAARASAELEIARRGLVASVVNLYYSVSVSKAKQHLLEEALHEAESFTDLTQKREAAREGAHADVVKAQLQQQQRQRDLSDATLAADKARLELAVLLFPDPRTPYSTEESAAPLSLPTREEVNRLAETHNPELRGALAEVQAGNAEVASARAAYLPDVGLNFSYGIDAPQFAKRNPSGVQNLGYSISGTLNIPVWDWFSTQKRIKQSEIRRDAARVMLTAAQRRLIAALEEAYAEASAARDQVELLDLSVRTAAESLHLTTLRYSAGEATALEVVDAQTAYVSVATAQSDGVVRYQNALAGLQVLTGTM